MGKTDFSGHFVHNIDPKGRVTIPAAYRESLGDHFTLGLNNEFSALALYPKEEWDKIRAQLDKIPVSDARGMAYVRLILAFSFADQQLDGQGRILLPATLRSKVGLEKSITFVSSSHSLEIWDTDKFDAFTAQTMMNFGDVMGYVNDRYFAPQGD